MVAESGRGWLVLSLALLILTACSGGEPVPDEVTVRAELLPRVREAFDELGLEPDLEEASARCPARIGLGGTPTLAIIGYAPADSTELATLAQLRGVSESDEVRWTEDGYEFLARIVGEGVLQLYASPQCPE